MKSKFLPKNLNRALSAEVKDVFAFETGGGGRVRAMPECLLKSSGEVVTVMARFALKTRENHLIQTGKTMNWIVVVSGFCFGGRIVEVKATFEFKKDAVGGYFPVLPISEFSKFKDLDKRLKAFWN